MEARRFFLDGNVYDYILDKKINIEELRQLGSFFTSMIQESEITAISDESRRSALLEIYHSLAPTKLQFELAILMDNILLTDEQVLVDYPSEFVTQYTDPHTTKPWMDAMLVEISKGHDLILVTNDKGMTKKAEAFGITVFDACKLIDTL